MSVFKFTDPSVRNAPPGEHADLLLPNLYLFVGKGRRTWFCRPRVGGKRQRVRLGHYPQMSVAAARTAYRETIERLDAGAAALPATPHPRSADAASLGTLLDHYQGHREREGAPKTMAKRLRAVRREFAEHLALPARSLSKHDVRAVRDRLYGRGARSMWNDVRSGLSSVLEWAIEEDIADANVARSVGRAAAHKRERVLTDAEIVAVWHATFELEKRVEHADPRKRTPALAVFARLVRFLILTACRRSEGAGMMFGELLDGTWRLPAERSKNGKGLTLRLPQLALDQLGEGAARDLCFAGKHGTPIGSFSNCLRELHAASGTSAWSLHDLRRTAASKMQELHIRPDTIEAILNHALPGLSAVAGIYLRGELEAAKGQALATWAAHVEQLVGAGARSIFC